MKKRILTILLLISPYLYILIVVLCFKLSRYLSSGVPNVLLIFCGFVVTVFIPNMIYAFVIAKRRGSSTELLLWDMLLKLCNIPIYLVVFSFGLLMSLFPKGVVVIIPLAIFDYMLLLPSSMYGVSGLLQARRERKITTVTAVFNCILHFFFCLDVISAIVMFCIVKVNSKRQS